MARVPYFVATPLRYSADVASAYSSMLARYADLLRSLAGEETGSDGRPDPGSARFGTTTGAGGVSRPSRPEQAPADAQAPAGGRGAPARPDDEDHTVGRQASERKEPTPEPARGASAASASRRVSNPKAARKVRERKTRATTVTSVETTGGTGRGGTPEAPAENTPKTRARNRQGREPAPMGAKDDSAS